MLAAAVGRGFFLFIHNVYYARLVHNVANIMINRKKPPPPMAANNKPRSYLSTAPHSHGRSIGGKPLTALSPKPPFPPPTSRARNRATVLIVVLLRNTTAPKSRVTSCFPLSAGHNTAFCPFLAFAVASLRAPSTGGAPAARPPLTPLLPQRAVGVCRQSSYVGLTTRPHNAAASLRARSTGGAPASRPPLTPLLPRRAVGVCRQSSYVGLPARSHNSAALFSVTSL